MSRMVLGIVGSYRKGGSIDQTVSAVLASATAAGAATDKIYLLDSHIEFCTNCRRCTQQPGPNLGRCFLEDLAAMREHLELPERMLRQARSAGKNLVNQADRRELPDSHA